MNRRVSLHWLLAAVAVAAACIVLIGPWVLTDQRRTDAMTTASHERKEQTTMLQEAREDRKRALRWIAAICRAEGAECRP